VGFGRPAQLFEQQRLRRMETRQIGRPARIVREILRQERRGAVEKRPCLGEKGGGFRLHRSSPSCRTSCINGVRSL
jgi:hypothetical protein